MSAKDWVAGARYEVVFQPATLVGEQPDGPYVTKHWSRELRLGEVLTCDGWDWGWGSDPGRHVHWSADDVPPGTIRLRVMPEHVDFTLLRTEPRTGVLRKIEEE